MSVDSVELQQDSPIVKSYILPGLPHPLLAAEKNSGWKNIAQAYDRVRQEIEALNVDVIILYSTYWPSVIGHQIQALPEPEWTHVDDQFHHLGSIPYKFKVDTDYAHSYNEKCQLRGLHSRTVAYEGFPIDTGSVVCLKMINPKNKVPMTIVSSNIYADRAETVVLGKAAVDALNEQNKKAVAIAITSLSNRLNTEEFEPKEDKIYSLKDQEWNEKFLEFLKEGRLEDVSQLSRQFHREARVPKVSNFKPFWWLSAVAGQNNFYEGEVFAYESICGTGAAVIGLTPSEKAARDLEYDEDDPEAYTGERNVIDKAVDEIQLDESDHGETRH